MRLPQASPGEGGKRSHTESWSNWEVKGGEKHFAYVAGPTQWFVAHPSSRTKPCVDWMTGGVIKCKQCALDKPTDEVGYMPLWRGVDWRAMFVVVYGSEREHIDPLRLHQRIIVGREHELGARIWVRTALDQTPTFSTTVARKREPQDITDSLLTIWGIAELRMWFSGAQVPGRDTAVSLPPVQPVPVSDDPRTGGVDAGLSRILSRAGGGAPSTNGKH